MCGLGADAPSVLPSRSRPRPLHALALSTEPFHVLLLAAILTLLNRMHVVVHCRGRVLHRLHCVRGPKLLHGFKFFSTFDAWTKGRRVAPHLIVPVSVPRASDGISRSPPRNMEKMPRRPRSPSASPALPHPCSITPPRASASSPRSFARCPRSLRVSP
ncbi:hypothetical protein QJS04_geneDACA001165 [Acorus gramineus]|uniref:Uncharacterized protein n=1 Tax=Acorus gramineus TaxID=55184 RepID=A0AAV9ADF4_ACOGR|nr:hypothetical protein QJS04_geneDACA001165 [Acorus gramineus]